MESNQGMPVEADQALEVIQAGADLTLAAAGRLQGVFLDALGTGAHVVLDCSGVARADLAGLQLLCSAHRTYRSRQARFELREPSEKLLETVRAAGYPASHSICPERRGGPCLWNVR